MSDFSRAGFVGNAGTLLSTYTPEVGAGFASDGDSGNFVLNGDGTVSAVSPGQAGTMRDLSTPPNANYTIEFEFKTADLSNGNNFQVYLRKTGSDQISLIYDSGASVLYIVSQVSGSFDVVGSVVSPFVPTINTWHSVKYECNGTAFKAYIDGVQKISGTTSSLTAVNHASLALFGGSQLQIRKYRAYPTGSPSSALSMAPNDAKVLYDPMGWLVNSSRALTVYPGSHLRFDVTGSSYVRIYFDTSHYGSDVMTVAWTFNGGPWQTSTLASGTNYIDLSIGMDGSRQTVEFYAISMPQSDPFSSNPVDAIRITSYEADLFSSFSATPSRGLTKVLIVNGDSISRGNHAGPGDTDDNRYTYVPITADAMLAEWSNFSIGGIGWLNPMIGGTQAFFVPVNDSLSSWNKTVAGTSRNFATVDYIVNFLGTNDAGSTDEQVSASVSGYLSAQRNVSAAYIFIVKPFFAAGAGVLAGFNAYQSATPDDKAFFVDLGTAGAEGVTSYPNASRFSPDGLHFNSLKHGQFAGLITRGIQMEMGGAGGGGINGTGILGMT